MPNTIDLFNTRKMLAMLEQRLPPRTFFLSTFFGGAPAIHDTMAVDIDIVGSGGRRMAPFVSPLHQGKVVDRAGYRTETFKPPYIKMKMPTTAQQLLTRQPGEVIYGAGNPESRARAQLARDMATLDDLLIRREEWMAREAIVNGAVTCTGDGISLLVDFGYQTDTHKLTLAAKAKWDYVASDRTSNPIEDLRTWRLSIIKRCGIAPTMALMGSSAVKAFRAHPDVVNKDDLLSMRRVESGQLDVKLLPNGVTYWGHITELGLDLYSYDEWYLDDAGNEQPMMPVGKVVLASPMARTQLHYGMVQDLDAGGNFSVARFAKSWTEKDPSVRWLLMQAAPIAVNHQPDAFQVITVV